MAGFSCRKLWYENKASRVGRCQGPSCSLHSHDPAKHRTNRAEIDVRKIRLQAHVQKKLLRETCRPCHSDMSSCLLQ